ncbi:MAG: DUF1269 domain-containing protein [Dehalococcoidia bacterium]
MPDVPIDVVVAAFNDEQGASTALNDLKTAHKEGLINVKDAAVLRRDMEDKLHITDTTDKGFGRGAILGGIAGAVVGVVAGPIGWMTLGGAAVGGLAAKLRDGGFRDSRLKEVGENLKPGSSAIIAVVEEQWVREVERMMRQDAADIATEMISADIATQLEMEGERLQTGDQGQTRAA